MQTAPEQQTLLIVEDSPEDRKLYQRYLQQGSDYSYTILGASLGQQGLDLWQQYQPDIILLDYRLPDLDGLEFLSRLQSLIQQPHLPVIMVTGQGSEAIAVQAMKAGAQDYLIKEQITPEGLHLAIHGAIETVQLRTELHQRVERERVVGQITRQIHQSLDLDRILQTTVTEVRQFLNTDRVLVFQLQPDGNGTVVAESVGEEWQSLLSSTIYDPCLAESYLRFSRPGSITHDPDFAEDYVKRYRQGEVTAIPDIHASDIDPCHIELLAQFQVNANLVVPILHDDLFWGLLIAHHCADPRLWQTLEIDLLKELATQLGIALRQAELYQQSQAELAERNRVEADLRDSEERLRSALEASRMGTWDWNMQTGQIQWSDNLEAMFGLEPGTFDGSFEMFARFLHPDDRDRVLAAVERAIATGEDYSIEFRVVYPNGTVRWALSQGKVFYNVNGQPVRMAGNDIDITERKIAEQALRENEQRFVTLAQASPVAIFQCNAANECLYVNSGWSELTGQPEEVALGMGWVATVHPDDRDRLTQEWLHWVQTAQPQKPYQNEGRVLRPDGSTRWYYVQALLLIEAGSVIGYIGTLTDITNRKQTEAALRENEQLLRLALEGAQAGSWSWDLTTGRLIWSAETYQLYGLDPANPLLEYEGWYESLLHPDDRPWVSAEIARAIDQRLSQIQIEFRILHPERGIRWLLSRGRLILNEQGEPIQLRGINLDITDRKQAEIALQESESRFRQLAENIDAVFWIKEVTDAGVSYVSPAYERLWGLDPQDLYESQQAWINYIHPDDRESVDRAFQAKAAAGLFDEEYRIILPNGHVRWVRDRCFPLRDEAGSLYRFTGIAEDITDRKQIEEMLRLQAQVLDQTHDSVVTTDLDGNIISWNKGAERVLGYTAEEVLGQPVATLYSSDQQEFLQSQVIAPLKANGEHEVEVSIRHKSGELLDLLLSLSLLRNEQQTPIGMIGFSIDITDRKRSEQALRESEERFRTSVENMLDCFAIYEAVRNQQGDIVDFQAEYINDAACLMSQIPREQHLSRGLCELLPTHRSIGLFDEYCQVVETGQPLVKDSLVYEDIFGEQRLIKAFDIRVARLGDGYIATWRDITERKQIEETLRENEQLLRLALEGAQAGSWDWEIPTGKVVWSPENYALYGLDPATSVPSYETWYNALYPDDREAANAEVAEVIEQRLPEFRSEFRIIHPRLGLRWLLGLGQLTLDGWGNPLRLSGINLDITDRKQSEMERDRLLTQEQAARESAERANRIKDEFLAVLSHELRSPLNPILGWTKLMQSRKFDATKTSEALATIERNAKLQTQLIDDLLDVAKILRGKLSMNEALVDLTFVIEAAIDTVRAAAVAKNITLHAVLPQIGRVSGDAARLQQIVWNLLSNAIKFTPTQGRVEIRLEREGNQAKIIVSDTGKGINSDFLPYIFESFRQEDASTTRQYGGLGLGLAIVRYLVEAHGGTIDADSPGEGQGATFIVQLPLLAAESEQPSFKVIPTDELDLTGIRILAIDDEPDARELLTVLLTQYGAEVLTITLATEVLTHLESFQPDVLISDIGMPGVDGYMLMRQIRALPPEKGGQVLAIALTAYAREEDYQQAIKNGYQRHLTKPLDLDQLVQVVLELVRPATGSSTDE